MSKGVSQLKTELADAERALAAERRENLRLRSATSIESTVSEESVHSPQGAPKKRWDALTWATIGLDVLTLLSVLAILLTTRYTVHNEEENRFLPLATLTTRDDATEPDRVMHTLVIRNVGFGPALNAVTHIVDLGDGGQMRLNHRTVLATTEVQDIAAEFSKDRGITFADRSTPIGKMKRGTLVGTVADIVGSRTVNACVSYENTRRERYETWHELKLPATGDPSNFQVNYLCQAKVFGSAATCKTPCASD